MSKWISVILLVILITLVIALNFTIINAHVNTPLEYTCKYFSQTDINRAMAFHGVDSVIITQTDAYFYRDSVKCKLFTNSCIKHLYKQKQSEIKKVDE